MISDGQPSSVPAPTRAWPVMRRTASRARRGGCVGRALARRGSESERNGRRPRFGVGCALERRAMPVGIAVRQNVLPGVFPKPVSLRHSHFSIAVDAGPPRGSYKRRMLRPGVIRDKLASCEIRGRCAKNLVELVRDRGPQPDGAASCLAYSWLMTTVQDVVS